MTNWEKGRFEKCERFREELELARLPEGQQVDRKGLLVKLSAELRGHAEACGSCLEAADDLVETRNMLVKAVSETGANERGVWFSSKVMNAIAAQEREIEQSEGVWQSVRRLAPRLAAVCALLLVLAGTWAVQVRRDYVARQMAAAGESLFEPTPSAALNDDVMMSVEAHR
ncbi:MAG TPA: hypothetical protein VGH37_07215 [Candidatus Acidoferrum sp.]